MQCRRATRMVRLGRCRQPLNAVRQFPLIALLMLLLTGCGGDTPIGNRSDSSAIVLVAASTSDAMADLATRFEADNPAMHVTSVPGPSNALARQILSGAPADLYLSANQQWADEVQHAGLAIDSRPLLGNDLVLIVPSANPGAVHAPADLTGPAVRHVALAGEHVPAGIYATQALRQLGLLDALADRMVRGNDVRAALAWVERGEAEAGVVYATDARMSPGVVAVHTFQPGLHDAIVYPLVRLTHGRDNAAAAAFADYLLTDDAAAVLAAHGFRRLP